MLLLGVLLVLIGLGALAAGLFGIEVSSSGQVEILGIDVAAQTLFILGVVATLAVWWGYRIGRFGARRELKQRREQKQYDELAQKLDRAEAGRDRDLDDEDRRR